ncbi:unnamed protein product [Allacma fusca]|uniref:Uncharacterized protein n=1 Tax=Allacma fusca TaxID=39272 RepID=A0A8J2NME3_9HEXA|nr:unnamed protein product [Allacma fusca]
MEQKSNLNSIDICVSNKSLFQHYESMSIYQPFTDCIVYIPLTSAFNSILQLITLEMGGGIDPILCKMYRGGSASSNSERSILADEGRPRNDRFAFL